MPGVDVVIQGHPANVLCRRLTLLHVSTGQDDVASWKPRIAKNFFYKKDPLLDTYTQCK